MWCSDELRIRPRRGKQFDRYQFSKKELRIPLNSLERNEKAAGFHRRQGLWLFEVQLVIQEVVGKEVEKDILHQEVNQGEEENHGEGVDDGGGFR